MRNTNCENKNMVHYLIQALPGGVINFVNENASIYKKSTNFDNFFTIFSLSKNSPYLILVPVSFDIFSSYCMQNLIFSIRNKRVACTPFGFLYIFARVCSMDAMYYPENDIQYFSRALFSVWLVYYNV